MFRVRKHLSYLQDEAILNKQSELTGRYADAFKAVIIRLQGEDLAKMLNHSIRKTLITDRYPVSLLILLIFFSKPTNMFFWKKQQHQNYQLSWQQSKKDDKDQEMIQSSTTPDPSRY